MCCLHSLLVSKAPEITCSSASNAGPGLLELSGSIMKLKFGASLSRFFSCSSCV